MSSFDQKDRSPIRRITHGALHTVGSTFVGRLVNWVAVIILTRELTRDDFGTVALAAAILGIVIGARNFGLHLALIRHYDRVDELAPTHFVINTALSTAGTLVAGAIAYFYVLPKYGQAVAASLSVFALFDLLRGAAQTAETQLRRDLEFTSLAHIHAISLVLAAVGGIVLVRMGTGYWALVFSHAVFGVGYVTLYVLQVWRRRLPWPLALSQFDRDGARDLMKYGRWIWAGALLQAILLNADRLIVITRLGVGLLGIYERAHTFAQLPTGAVTTVITGIMNTVFARYQADRERLSGAFRRTLRVVMRAVVPLTLILAIEIPRLTHLLLTDHWLPIVGVLRFLVIYSICRPLLEAVHALLRGIGEARGMIGFAAVQAVVLLLATPLLADSHGIEGVAMGMNLMALIGATLGLRRISRHVDVPWMRTLAPPLLAGVAATAIRIYAEGFIGEFPNLLALISGIACFSVCYVAFLFALEGRTLAGEFRTLLAVLRNNEHSL